MSKKIFIVILLVLLATGVFGIHKALQYRQNSRVARQNAKTPEVSLTILEGWTINNIADYLEKKGVARKQQFIDSEKNFNISAFPLLASKPKTADLEGFLFPDTYLIYDPKAAGLSYSVKNFDPSAQLIGKMLDNFSQKITPQIQEQAKKRRLSLFQIVTLASIVEKETGQRQVGEQANAELDGERKIVASIFYNRLAGDLALQSDATINFITGKKTPQVSLKDQEVDSLYNTYKYHGLPPGPICNPSLSAIMSVLYPQTTDYFYFLTDPETGKAVFAKTYEEHLKNKQKFLK